MFLFTTPPARSAPPASPVVEAIRAGAERTGTDFDYLLATARRESALDPRAKARTSSATGLFQFIEQTWLGVMKSDGAKQGLAAEAAAITTRPDGTHAVADPARREAILRLREDPAVASAMAGALTQRNRERLHAELGREPTNGDLYAAHFLGARGAADLARAVRNDPEGPAASAFPDAAAANRPIFFDRSGRSRSAREVYALLAANPAASPPSAAPAYAPERPLAFARADGPALHGLFRTDGRAGPVNEAVARLWRTGAEPVRTASLAPFFPRGSGEGEESAAPAVAPAPPPARADVPLPPRRPADLGVLSAAKATAPTTSGRPLDLAAFRARRP